MDVCAYEGLSEATLAVRDMGGGAMSVCWCVRGAEAALVPVLVLADLTMGWGMSEGGPWGPGNCGVLSECCVGCCEGCKDGNPSTPA